MRAIPKIILRVVDRPTQQPTSAPLGCISVAQAGGLLVCSPQSTTGVVQQLLGVGHGAVGQIGQVSGDPVRGALGLLTGLGTVQAQLGHVAWARRPTARLRSRTRCGWRRRRRVDRDAGMVDRWV